MCSLHVTVFGSAFVPIWNCVPSASASVASKHLSVRPTFQLSAISSIQFGTPWLLTSVNRLFILIMRLPPMSFHIAFSRRGSASQRILDSLCIYLQPPSLPSLQPSREINVTYVASHGITEAKPPSPIAPIALQLSHGSL